jgi:cell division protein FtsB
MTEEIIIDGVNVAGCDGLNKNSLPLKQCNLLQFKTKDGGIAGRWCTDHSNCYYKQLKRLEQENKELKEQNETLNYQWHKQSEIGDEWYKIAEKYKTALEKIRDLCIHYENTNDKCVINCYAHFIVTDLIQNKINEVLQ